MAEPSNAQVFFEQIRDASDSFLFIQLLLKNPDASENDWRDYKVGAFSAIADLKEQDEKVKEIWSEYLSAFSNTSGGVLVWGIETKGTLPHHAVLVPDCERLAERLRQLVNNATDPFVPGVEVLPIPKSAGSKDGLVVCLIPKSAFPPHRAVWGERTFFIRTQDACIVCPTALLRSLFYPRLQARLGVLANLQIVPHSNGLFASLTLTIFCRGPATAESVIAAIETKGIDTPGVNAPGHWQSRFGVSNFLSCDLPLVPNFAPPIPITVGGPFAGSNIQCLVRLFAHNMPMQVANVEFSDGECRSAFNEKQHKRVTAEPWLPEGG